MATLKIRQLVDLAIGFPETGYVDFSALHSLLVCIVDKLGIADETVGYHDNTPKAIQYSSNTSNYELCIKSEVVGGDDLVEENNNATQPEEEASQKSFSIYEDQAVEQSKNQDSEYLIEASSMPSSKEVAMGSIIDDLIPKSSVLSQLSIEKLKQSENRIEIAAPEIIIPKELSLGISIMKHQIEYVIEQMLLLTSFTLKKTLDSKPLQDLYSMTQGMLEIRKENIYIEDYKLKPLPSPPSLDWQSFDLHLRDNLLDNSIQHVENTASEHVDMEFQATYPGEEEDHLCYSPAKLLDQLTELKEDFGRLTNKVNELSSPLLQNDGQRSSALIQDIQNEIRDIKLITNNINENQSHFREQLASNQTTIENAKESIKQIFEEKIDKIQLETHLASKVEYDQLQRKVSLDQVLEMQCCTDKKFAEILRRVDENEKKMSGATESLQNTPAVSAFEEELKNFKDYVNKDIQNIHNLLKNYIKLTDDGSAAGTRVKVLQDLVCLSCDASCVMRTMERATVAKLPSAHVSNTIRPLTTYELSSIRKSGLMGYNRKDSFLSSSDAWLAKGSNIKTSLKKCVPRRAGGNHTITSAKDRVRKKKL